MAFQYFERHCSLPMLSPLIRTDELEFRTYTAELAESVKAFNQRLREGGESENAFPERHLPNYPRRSDTDLYQERFLLLHNGQVRGGYIATHQSFAIHGKRETVACAPQLAVSEGIINHRYGMFGVLLVEHALAKQPLMYALGIGGTNERQAKLLNAMGWTLYPVPFYFKVLRPARFLANINYLRGRRVQRMALDFLRYTGMGWLGLRVAQFRLAKPDNFDAQSFDSFGEWADELWERSREEYSLISHRDSKTLNVIYPSSEPRFLRLKVCRGQETLGWVVMLDTQMSGHMRFGNMRVGFIMDCLARPEDASSVVQVAARYLENRAVDLIVSNQASAAWCKALAMSGFLHGPSTFILGLSPQLAEKLHPFELVKETIHINRGNGHGPISKW